MRIRLIFIILAVSLLFSIPVNALTPPNLDGGHSEEGSSILCTEYDRPDLTTWPYIKNIIVLESDEELKIPETDMAPSNMLPLQMAYVCESGRTINVDVVWNISDETLMQPGLHQVIGYPVIDDEKVLLAEGYDGKVTWPVFRKGGEPLETISLQKPLLLDPLLALNSDPSNLHISTDGRSWGVGVDGIIRNDDTWVWTWDYSEVDTSKEGSYTITGTLEPPEWISVDDVDKTHQHTVYVLPTDRIEIYAACETLVIQKNEQISQGELIIKWLYDSTNVTEAVLQRMDGNGLWIDCDDIWYRYNAPSKFVEGSTAKLRLRLLEIPVGIEHKFRLHYLDVVDGETVERFTAPITLTVPENIEELLADSSIGIPEGLDIGGDRDEDDFGDQGEKPPSGEIIPPPETTVSTPNDTPHQATTISTSEPVTEGTSMTENTSSVTDEINKEQQDGEESPHTFDHVISIFCLVVAVSGIVCVLLLLRKEGRR